jgi:hypothetical protein
MATDWTTSIQIAAIRTAGNVVTNVDITRAETSDMEAHVTVGTVLARIKGRHTAQRLAAIWRDAALHTHRLVANAGLAGRGNPDAECPAGLVIRIGPDAALRQDLMPPTPALPVHIRIQVGPLVWLVMDRAAYNSTRNLWDQIERLLS